MPAAVVAMTIKLPHAAAGVVPYTGLTNTEYVTGFIVSGIIAAVAVLDVTTVLPPTKAPDENTDTVD